MKTYKNLQEEFLINFKYREATGLKVTEHQVEGKTSSKLLIGGRTLLFIRVHPGRYLLPQCQIQ